MTEYPVSGIKLVADTAAYTTAMNDAIFLADYLDSIGTISIDVAADVSEAESALQDLPLSDENVDFTVNVDQTGDDITDVTELKDETVTETVDVQQTDTAEKSLSALETLKDLKILETVWNITGTAVDLIGKFADFSVTPMLNLEDAVARVNAQTGNAIPNAEKLIKGIFYDDLGKSIDEVANMVAQAHALGLPIEDATRAALEFTHTFSDQNPETVLKSIDQILKAGLAPDAQTAGDMLVVAFQNGANKGNDLLEALNSNATAIKGMGLTGPQALSFIKTGMDNGLTSANQVLQALEKIKQNVQNAAGNKNSDVTKTLNMLGIANPAETGQAWSADFFSKVIDGIKNAKGLSDTEKEVLFTNLIGGKQGGKTFAAFLQMSPTEAASIFENVAGAAATAASDVDNSLRGAIDDFTLAAQKAAEDFLSSKAIDLPGKIAALKTGLQDALNVLANGGDLGQALTIALKPIGFDDEFQGLESALGNFVIGILQAVAAIQDATGHGAEAAGTRATVAGMANNQLGFDLQIANPEQVAGDISTAISRGVSTDTVMTTAADAVDALISDGALDRAQKLTDALKKQSEGGVVVQLVPNMNDGDKELVRRQVEASGLGTLQVDGTVLFKPGTTAVAAQAFADELTDSVKLSMGEKALTQVAIAPTMTPESVAALQDQVNKAVANSAKQKVANTKDEDLTSGVTGAIDAYHNLSNASKDLTDKVNTLNPKQVEAAQNAQKLADAAAHVRDNTAGAKKPVDEVSGAMSLLSFVSPSAASGLLAVNDAIQKIIETAAAVTADNIKKDKAKQDAAAANTTADPGKHASGGSFVGTGIVGDQGQEIVSSNTGLAVLNNMTTNRLMSALNSYIPGQSGGGGSSKSFTVNNFNNVPNQATGDALGYKTAETIRGMAKN